MPMTSPVERISGERSMSTPGNLLNGNTGALTQKAFGATSSVKPSCSRVIPAMSLAACLASGTPIALETKGTVREARGLTSMT